MNKNKILILILSVLISQTAGVIGAVLNLASLGIWYNNLDKPFFTPPDWIFGPVWILLFSLIGVSLYLVLISDAKREYKKTAVSIFFLQWVLNIFWSFMFFTLRNPFYGFLEISALSISIVIMISIFRKINKASAYLLIPYLLWVLFAAALNFSIWRMNS